jgi:putative endonuclease
MADDRKRYGQSSEQIAARFLKRNGYKIIERNYRTALGEIDIVARHKGVLVFVEVKARRTGRFGHPAAAVTTAKQRKISMAALVYLKANRAMEKPARFDVVSIMQTDGPPQVEVITNAFELAYT